MVCFSWCFSLLVSSFYHSVAFYLTLPLIPLLWLLSPSSLNCLCCIGCAFYFFLPFLFPFRGGEDFFTICFFYISLPQPLRIFFLLSLFYTFLVLHHSNLHISLSSSVASFTTYTYLSSLLCLSPYLPTSLLPSLPSISSFFPPPLPQPYHIYQHTHIAATNV